jgi:hypothetical protein
MCLVVRLAVGLGQCYIGDVCTFCLLEDTGHLSWCHYSPFESEFRTPFVELFANTIHIAI